LTIFKNFYESLKIPSNLFFFLRKFLAVANIKFTSFRFVSFPFLISFVFYHIIFYFLSRTPGMPPSFFPPSLPPFITPSGDASSFNLGSLSVEELLEMEGQERENVEARIRVLRNVHSLLDSVILQLNQYSSVINTLK